MKKINLDKYHQQKSMNKKDEMTESRGTPELIQLRSERKPSTLHATDLSERQLAIHLMRLLCRPNICRLARRPLCETRSKALEISRETTLLSP